MTYPTSVSLTSPQRASPGAVSPPRAPRQYPALQNDAVVIRIFGLQKCGDSGNQRRRYRSSIAARIPVLRSGRLSADEAVATSPGREHRYTRRRQINALWTVSALYRVKGERGVPYLIVEVRRRNYDLIRQSIGRRVDGAVVQNVTLVASDAYQQCAGVVRRVDRIFQRSHFLGRGIPEQRSPARIDDRSSDGNRVQQRSRGVGYGCAVLGREGTGALVKPNRHHLGLANAGDARIVVHLRRHDPGHLGTMTKCIAYIAVSVRHVEAVNIVYKPVVIVVDAVAIDLFCISVDVLRKIRMCNVHSSVADRDLYIGAPGC